MLTSLKKPKHLQNRRRLELWIEGGNLERVNGLFCYLCAGTPKGTINYETKEISVLKSETGSIDGLKEYKKGEYLFSDWQGHVYFTDGNTRKVIDLTKTNMNAADIEYVASKNICSFQHSLIIKLLLQAEMVEIS